MLIAHLSDFHVFAEAPETSLVRFDVERICRKIIADVVALDPAIDLCLISGDLTDGGSPQDYALFADIIAPVRAPVLVVPGNHDRRANFRNAFAGRLPFAPGPDLNYEVKLPGIRALGLDTLIEGQIPGALSDAQLDWLAQKLAAPVSELTLIIMHHPAFPSGVVPLDRMALTGGRDRFGDIIASYSGPLRIHAGHIHRPFQTLWKGVCCFVSGSPAFQHELVLDPRADEPGAINEPYAYFLHKIAGPHEVSVHTRYVSL